MANIPWLRAVLRHEASQSAWIQPLVVVCWPYTTPPHALLLNDNTVCFLSMLQCPLWSNQPKTN